MSNRRLLTLAALVLAALASSGCPHQAAESDAYVQHVDAGPPDPSFEGPIPFDDVATMAID